MKTKSAVLNVACFCLSYYVWLNQNVLAQKDHVAPGVDPRQYQQPTPTEQQDGIKFHDPNNFVQQPNQQIPQQQLNQQQQQPPNHQQQESLQGQPEVGTGGGQPHAPHGHQAHGHGIGESVDADHMKQHDNEEYVDFSKMSQPQIIMHHFRQFDQNKDGKVDGLEIFKKIRQDNDAHSGDEGGQPKATEELHQEFETLSKTVDQALQSYDENNDGYIYYGEFYRAHSKLQRDADKTEETQS